MDDSSSTWRSTTGRRTTSCARCVPTSSSAGLQIQVSAEAGRLLALLVRLAGATRVLELGTLFGYSGIWMARELPPGRASRHGRGEPDARRRGRALVRARRPGRSRHGAPRRRAGRARDGLRRSLRRGVHRRRQGRLPRVRAHLARAAAAGRPRDRRQRDSPRADRAGRRRCGHGRRSARCTTCSAATRILVSTTVPVGDGLAMAVKRASA